MQVYDTANKLAQEIRESEEYKLYKQRKDEIQNDPGKKQKVEDLYNEIGKKLYENHVRAEKIDIVSKIEDICKEIDAYADEIELTRKEILKLKDLKQCKKCNYEMELEYKFCPNCGEEQKEVLENKEENSENVSNVKKENEEDK